MKKKNEMIHSILNLPTPLNISYLWNMGSLLGVCLITQILTGIFLSMHYTANVNLAFNSIIHIMQNVNYGWMIRFMHMNGASFFFMCMYLHIARGIYYSSYKFKATWMIGITMYLITMMTAFLGYVLPWGQMSLWGATVITNLISAFPMMGEILVKWLWGGFSVSNPTLNRFYSFHFIMPFIVMFLTLIHLSFLHQTGSSNPLGLNSNFFKISFHPYFSYKDLMGFIILIFMLLILCMNNPYLLLDPDNYIKANSMITPFHIKPEWYFLFAYAILRSIPNKLGGVIALMMSILIMMVMPYLSHKNMKSFKFNILNKIMYWNFTMIFIMLTWIGSKPVEIPYIFIGQSYSILYFMYYFLIFLMFNF